MPRFRSTAPFLLAYAVSTASAQTWVELGPAPTTGYQGATGRVSALAAHPTDPDLLYAAGADGGVWKSLDAGQNWTPITGHLPTTAIGALAIHPSDPDTLYAGSGEGNFANHSRYGLGLYKTTDGGATWRVLAPETFAGRCFSTIAIDPNNPQHLLAGIVRAGGFPAMAGAKGHPQREGPVGLFRSTDAGETWSLVPGLPQVDATDVAFDPANPAIVYVGIGRIFGHPDNAVYRSTDGGATWTRLTLPRTTLGRIGFATAPGIVLAVLVNPADALGGSATTLGVARSTNAGQTWTFTTGVGGAPYGWYFARLGLNPFDPAVAYSGEVGLYRSTTGGQSFGSASVPHPDVHAFAWDAAGRLIAGTDGGVYRSDTGSGAPTISRNAGLGIIQMYAGLSTHPTDDRVFLAGLQDNGSVIRRPDSPGKFWSSVTGGDGGWTQISPHNPAVMLTQSQGTGQLYRSTNGGQNFFSVGSGISGRNCFLPPFVYDPRTPGRMLYATERVWVSTNDGGSFSPLSGDLTAGGIAAIRALASAPSDPDLVYAATNDGRVLASLDGGSNFALRLTNNPGWPRVTRELRVHPFEPETVYLAGAVFGVPHVRRSRDAGATWQTLDGPGLPDTPINVIGVDHRGLVPSLYAGGDGGVWRSADDGATWTRFGDGLPHAAVIDLHVEPRRGPTGRLVIGTQGRGAWLVPLPCLADFNGDGFADFFDYDAYIEAFEAGSLGADTNADGFLDFFDYDRFAAEFEAGC
jgi:photosystem II stability/assembly factor-like uncharacterized protein